MPAELLDATARRSRRAFGERVRELRDVAPSLALAAVAAAVAWIVAREVFDHRPGFFAPVAAILTLGLTVGRRGRRAWEIGLGVAVGITVADLIVLVIGTGTWQLGVVVFLSMAAAVLAGGGLLLVNQAAISAVLIVTLQAAQEGVATARFIDALIGSVIALLANAVAPGDPLRMVRREAEPLLRQLGEALSQVAAALRDHDRDAAGEALARARGLEPQVAALREALQSARETTLLAPSRRRARPGLAPYATAATQIDHAVRNTRVLARRAISAIESDERVPMGAIQAIDELAAAAPGLAHELAEPEEHPEIEEAAIRAAALATAALEVTGNLSASVIVGQVRAMAADLLGAIGIEPEEAREAVRGARSRLGV
jgi:uncharacterized membrane protein YgaE (UPF0421/DUF939 family)